MRFCHRLAWIGGALAPALQPARLIAGFFVALFIWLPGLGWDALTGPTVDAPGYLAEPYDDAEHAAVQVTLRRLAADYAPDLVFEGARIPPLELADALHERAMQAPDAPARDSLLIAAAHAASLAPQGAFHALLQAQGRSAAMVIDGLLGLTPADVALGIRLSLWDTPRAIWQRQPVFAVAFGLWGALVLAVGLGALARMEAWQAAGRGTLSAREGFTFAAQRWADLVVAWLGPLGIVALLTLLCVGWGLLFASSWSAWLAGWLYGAPLLVGVLMAGVLLVWGLGAPLAPAAVACDGLDGFDASQRGAFYAIARPGAWLACMAVVVIVAGAGLVLVRIVAWLVTGLTAAAVGLTSPEQMEWLRVIPDPAGQGWSGVQMGITWWISLVALVAAGGFFSVLGGLLTRAYLSLRAHNDGQLVEDVWPVEVPLDITDPAEPQAAPDAPGEPGR